ncbi:conserved Plasmodium protein, unknown function [Plasmodium sp. gorilla clade G3]|nr:conserved Plasmodium protein, unknown function [Plasmodium sp. gorilla clade G3]
MNIILMIYAFTPKILLIQVVINNNKRYLSDYCSYSCIDKNTLKYIIKLFDIRSYHIKDYQSFPKQIYKKIYEVFNQVCKKLGDDFNDLYNECSNRLNLMI